ncbi:MULTISPECIES: fumarylacetoacetate hydrolase family protein [unclassified Variovorax]|uniref:fumarylacetoacetate hydrolase family protein n=1 Tax=unclassified Variovorax TaxID=663243 RepID=UPI0008AAD2A4|nr:MULTISPECIES: fumarylacetoacetate hydrolase family protein [unclassified Variovorax]SEK17025.1 2-keto-4-pentenoate hydratase/2-oxohepta-3-ene-1,7-dioic acid hydratase (catechol pathway) [Variovorax sp. OK202]SFE68620.1 2-keto-4-pentenoate hydratase/2-oxohepta-3-ene-1,7-dioic acid hydratase (catechol pathway) [Variovorax sp. OK212]
MKFTTYLRDGAPRLAVVDGNDLIDLNDAQPKVPADLRAALKAGTDLHAAARAALGDSAARRVALAGVPLAPLVPEPGKTVCLGLNYFDHAKEGGREKPDYPWFFFRGASSLIAHGDDGVVPSVSARFDYEAELAVVIGRKVPRHTREADALAYVFGYSCFNDMSVRDYQKRTPQWTIGKNFDGTGAFGPLLVTADELPPGAAGLKIQGRLNGQVMQDANTSDMIFNVAETIALLADVLTLEPGDVIVMGTPAGVGQARTPPVWMKAGDTYEVEIERIGTLANAIVNEAR